MCAAYVQHICGICQGMYAKKQLAGKQLDTIRNYLVHKAVPNELRSRALEYYEYLFTSSQSLASSINYSSMPPNLAAQLALSINRKLVAKCTFFRDVSNKCIVMLISELQPAIFVPGQLIVFEGTPLTTIFFINRGLVQLLERTQSVGSLRDGDNFGLGDFVTAYHAGVPPTVRLTVKAVGYCDVMTLPLERLREIVLEDETFRLAQAAQASGEKSHKPTKQARRFCDRLTSTPKMRLRSDGFACDRSRQGHRLA